MSKRRRTDGLTGGTGDIKPQYLTATTGTAAINTYGTIAITLPVPRFGAQKNKSTITELLSVDWYIGIGDLGDNNNTAFAWLSTKENRADGVTSDETTLAVDLNDPTNFAFAIKQMSLLTSGLGSTLFPIHIDLTDGNGNGFLIATDRLQITMGNISGTATSQSIAKIKYRLVNVGLPEYIGIIQSQQ